MRKISLGLVALTVLSVGSIASAHATDQYQRMNMRSMSNYSPSYGKNDRGYDHDKSYGKNDRGYDHDKSYGKNDRGYDHDKSYGKNDRDYDKHDRDSGYSYSGLNARR
jgi:hypothetical protein